MNQFAPSYEAVAAASADVRADFIKRTYLTLGAAIGVFLVISAFLVFSGLAVTIANVMTMGRFAWLITLGLFMGASYLGENMAINGASRMAQMLGLGIVVVAWSIIFTPIILFAIAVSMESTGDPLSILGPGLGITAVLFGGLTGVVLLTKKDFSFLRSVVMFGGFAAMILIVASLIFGFELGIMFCWAMVALASVSILYKTSQVLHVYRTDQHIAAATTLFASFALLLWYVLRILSSRR